MALQEDKHIKRIVDDKSTLSGAGPDRLKKSQIAIQRDGSDRRMAFRDENDNYYEVSNRGEVFGPTGQQGATGLIGGQGDTGAQGFTGAQGHSGVQGSIGDTGAQGFTGAIGGTGYCGATGSQGETGAQGFTGVGATGLIGETGISGPTGAQGHTGAEGETGSQGDTGAQGPTGYCGATGSQGETGLRGVTGLANFTRGSVFPITPEDRTLYWDNEDEILYFYDGATAMAWIDISSGAIGTTGMPGPIGPEGPTGAQGATGVMGFFQYNAGVMSGAKQIDWSNGVKQGLTVVAGAAGNNVYFANQVAGADMTLVIGYDVNEVPTMTGLCWLSGSPTPCVGLTGSYDKLDIYSNGVKMFARMGAFSD